jgi:hypothetical protein
MFRKNHAYHDMRLNQRFEGESSILRSHSRLESAIFPDLGDMRLDWRSKP